MIQGMNFYRVVSGHLLTGTPVKMTTLFVTVQPSKDSDKTGKEMFPYRSRFR